MGWWSQPEMFHPKPCPPPAAHHEGQWSWWGLRHLMEFLLHPWKECAVYQKVLGYNSFNHTLRGTQVAAVGAGWYAYYIRTHMCINTCIHIYIYIHHSMYIYIYIISYIVCMYIYIYIYIHIFILYVYHITFIYIYVYIYNIYTYIQVCVCVCWLQPPPGYNPNVAIDTMATPATLA